MGKWIGFSFFLYVMGMLFGSIPVGISFLENTTATAPINSVLGYQIAYTSQSWGQQVFAMLHLDFFQAIFKILTLDFPIFGAADDPAQILRWIFLGPIVAVVGFNLILSLISIFQYVLT